MVRKIVCLGIVGSFVLLVGCATKKPLMDFTYVSTKQKQVEPASGQKIATVESDWICKGKEGLGLMETAVNNALEKAGNGATYLKNASFSQKGNCVMASGDAYK